MPNSDSPSALIDQRIADLADWRGETLAKVRALIKQALPDVVEEVKWRKPTNPLGVAVWEHAGIICTGEIYKDKVKLTFAKGAALDDPKSVFNSSLEGNARRAIDLGKGEKINEAAFKTLIRAAAALNASKSKPAKAAAKPKKPVLLSGGNPQIAKGDGDAPVQAYIAAVPGWQQDVVRRLDALVAKAVPEAKKAVKWNSPFYGVEGQGWFMSFHVFKRFVKVTFFKGAGLKPLPPGATEKSGDGRWLDIPEDGFDEAQMTKWLKQAAKLPGWTP